MRGVPSFDLLERKVNALAELYGAERHEWGIDDGKANPLYVEFWGITKAATLTQDGHHREEFIMKTELNKYLNNKIRLFSHA